MTQFKDVSKVVIAMLALSAALSACQRRTDTGQANEPQSRAEQRAGTASDSARNESSGTSGTSSGASGSESTTGQKMDDSVITTKAKTALLADSGVKGSDIHIETDKGTVVLSGAVDSNDQIKRAEKIVKSIDGVKTVDNRLTVKQ